MLLTSEVLSGYNLRPTIPLKSTLADLFILNNYSGSSIYCTHKQVREAMTCTVACFYRMGGIFLNSPSDCNSIFETKLAYQILTEGNFDYHTTTYNTNSQELEITNDACENLEFFVVTSISYTWESHIFKG